MLLKDFIQFLNAFRLYNLCEIYLYGINIIKLYNSPIIIFFK